MLRAIASDIASAFNFLPEPPKRVSLEDNAEECRGSRACGKALTLLQFLFSALLIVGVVIMTKDEIWEFQFKQKLEKKSTLDDGGGPPTPSTVQGLFDKYDDGGISLLSCPCDSPTLRLGDVLTPLANSKQISFAFDPVASIGISGSVDAVNALLGEPLSDLKECLDSIDAPRLRSELGSALSKADLLASPLEFKLTQLLAYESSQPGFDYSARRAYHLMNTFANFDTAAARNEINAMLDQLTSTSPNPLAPSLAQSVCEFAFGIGTANPYPLQKWATRTCTLPTGNGGISLVPGRLAGIAGVDATSGAPNFAYLQAQRKTKFGMEMSGVISSLRQFANEFRDDLPNATFVTQSAVSRRELERLGNDTIKKQLRLAGARSDVLVPGAISGESTLFETDCKFTAVAFLIYFTAAAKLTTLPNHTFSALCSCQRVCNVCLGASF